MRARIKRKWGRGAELILLLGCAVGTAGGQSPISGENLIVSPPKGFKVGFDAKSGKRSITEFVPTGETVDDWTELLTVQVYHGATATAAGFLQEVGAHYANDCPGTTVAKGILTGHVNGYVVSMLLLKCPKNPKTGKPETTAFRVIKGTDALYSVQYAWRAVPSDQDLDKGLHFLSTVTVCDTRTPADHPCQSLEGWQTLPHT